MTPFRVLIVDDEPPARRRLRALFAGVGDFELAGECEDGDQAVARLTSEAFDLVLLDVRIPGRDGLEVVRAVGPANLPPVVFVTAFDDHAVAAFELHALDYLLKPFERARFEAMLARARHEIVERRRAGLAERLERLLAEAARTRPSEPLVLRTGGRRLLVQPAEIEWIEAADNYLRVHLAGEVHLVRGTLGALAQRLARDGFLRVHRSLLVHPRVVRQLLPQRSGEVKLVLRDGTVLVAARSSRAALARCWPRAEDEEPGGPQA